jgi:hypothetical protein
VRAYDAEGGGHPDGQPLLPMRAGGQARVLGEEKGEGTSGFVEPGPTDPVRSPSATHPLFPAPDPPVNSKGRVPRAGRLRAATVPPASNSQRVAADRPKRDDQLVNEGGNAPGRDRVPVTEDLAPPGEGDLCQQQRPPPVPNQPLALRGPFLHTLRALIGPIFVRKCSCPNLRSQRGNFYMGALQK